MRVEDDWHLAPAPRGKREQESLDVMSIDDIESWSTEQRPQAMDDQGINPRKLLPARAGRVFAVGGHIGNTVNRERRHLAGLSQVIRGDVHIVASPGQRFSRAVDPDR